MADQRLTDKNELTAPDSNDLFHTVDVSDTTGSPQGTSKGMKQGTFVALEKSTANIELNGSITSFYGNDTVRTGDITVDESVATLGYSARVKHNDTVDPGILFVTTDMDIVTLGSYSVGKRNDIWMSKTGANELLVNYTQPDDGQLSQFFLDDFPTAFFAYSIRKISSNALGYSMQTLLPVSDIEWDANDEISNTSAYNGATVADFAGTAVSLEWYDQISGLTTEFLVGNNSSDSPTIIDSGTLVTASNGKAALSFDTGIRAMRKAAYTQLNSTNDFTIFIVASAATATGTEIGALLFSRDDTVGGNSAFGIYHDNRTDKLIGSVLNNSGGSTQFAEYITQQNNTDTRIITLVKSGNDLSFYLNDVLQQTVTYTGVYDNNIFVIGRRFDALDFDGYIQEIFGFSSVINAADRTKIYNNLNAFF